MSSMSFSFTSVYKLLPSKAGIFMLCIDFVLFSVSESKDMFAFAIFHFLLVFFAEFIHLLVKPLLSVNSLASSRQNI